MWLLRELDSRKIEAGITGSVGSETEPVISQNGSQWTRMMEDVHAANTYRRIDRKQELACASRHKHTKTDTHAILIILWFLQLNLEELLIQN